MGLILHGDVAVWKGGVGLSRERGEREMGKEKWRVQWKEEREKEGKRERKWWMRFQKEEERSEIGKKREFFLFHR